MSVVLCLNCLVCYILCVLHWTLLRNIIYMFFTCYIISFLLPYYALIILNVLSRERFILFFLMTKRERICMERCIGRAIWKVLNFKVLKLEKYRVKFEIWKIGEVSRYIKLEKYRDILHLRSIETYLNIWIPQKL